MITEEIARALSAKRNGKGWICKCPAHDDKNPSLKIDETQDGKILFKCFAGCSQEEIIKSLIDIGLWDEKRKSNGKSSHKKKADIYVVDNDSDWLVFEIYGLPCVMRSDVTDFSQYNKVFFSYKCDQLPENGIILDFSPYSSAYEMYEKSKNNFLDDFEKAKSGKKESKTVILKASDVEPEEIEWIWKGWLARKKLHILAGSASTGKTSLAISLAAIISNGDVFPNGDKSVKGNVLIWSGEDTFSDVLLPRFMACGGNRENLRYIRGFSENGKVRAFDPSMDFQDILDNVNFIPDIIIIDPIVAVIPHGLKNGDNTGTRKGLGVLLELAEKYNCAVIGITHFTKFTAGQPALERVFGSLAFGAVPRLVFATARQFKSDNNVFIRIKTNICDEGSGFEYSMEKAYIGNPKIETVRFNWGKYLEGSPNELMFESDFDFEEGTKMSEAKKFLIEELTNNPMKARDILAKARKDGIMEITLKRAKAALKIESKKDQFGGAWRWHLE